MFWKTAPCTTCSAHLARIEDLKGVIDRLTKDRENERAEYKRAIDALLVHRNLPAVGQGSAENRNMMDPTQLFRFFEEEVSEKKA